METLLHSVDELTIDIKNRLKNLKSNILSETENDNAPTESDEKPKERLVYYYPQYEYQINPDFIKNVIDTLKKGEYKKVVFAGGVDAYGFPDPNEKYEEYAYLFNYLKSRLKHQGIESPVADPTSNNILNETLAAVRSMDILSHLPKDVVDILKTKQIEFKKEHNEGYGDKYRYSRIDLY